MKTFSSYAVAAGGSSATGEADFEPVAYNAVLNLHHNPTLPNKSIELQGDCFIAVTDTHDGDKGCVSIKRGAGAEIITLNGNLSRPLNLPTGADAVIFLQYTNVNGLLYWFCLNELSVGENTVSNLLSSRQNLVIVRSTDQAQLFHAFTLTKILFATGVVNASNAFDVETSEYVVPATGVYCSTLLVRISDNADNFRSYAIIAAPVDDLNYGVGGKWKNTERTASTNRNSNEDVRYLSLTAGQRLRAFLYLDNFDCKAICEWSVYRLQ